MSLVKDYEWLETIQELPLMVKEALKEFGTHEVAGSANSPKILAWARECEMSEYNADSIPWCGLFMSLVAKRAFKRLPWRDPDEGLWALKWLDFGSKSEAASLGDVLVFKRLTGGHVGLYIGEDDFAFHVLGGNQSDSVSIARVAKARCVGVREPLYRSRPSSAVPRHLLPSGNLSNNEA